MGSLRRFALEKIRKKYNLMSFFETGTWKGDGLELARRAGFKSLVSCEIIPSVYEKALKRFKNYPGIKIVNQSSNEALEGEISNLEGNCLFWLDAHFPGAEEGLESYNNYLEENIRLPLETELEIIKTRRPGMGDVFLIDDLRIYEDGPFSNGNMPENIVRPKNRNIDFVYRLFGDTHEIIKKYEDEGYIIISPKNIESRNNANLIIDRFNKFRKKTIFP